MPKTEEEHTDLIYSRIDAVTIMILQNQKYMDTKRSSEICKMIMEKFDVLDRTAQRYLAEAKREVRRLGRVKKVKAYQRALRDREFIVQKFKNEDPKLALDAMKDRDKIMGLYVEHVEHSGSISLRDIDTSKLTDEQMKILKMRIRNKENVEEYLKLIGII